MLNASEEEIIRRKQLVTERQVGPPAAVDKACSSATIEITSDEDDNEEEDGIDHMYEFHGGVFVISDWEDEYDNDDYSDYNGLPGAYYGGYGVCFSCGERGHWSNGCPANPRRRRH